MTCNEDGVKDTSAAIGSDLSRETLMMHQDLLNRLGQANGQEIVFWIQIVFPGLVHDSEQFVAAAAHVRHNLVDLPKFGGGIVTVIPHTDYEPALLMILWHNS